MPAVCFPLFSGFKVLQGTASDKVMKFGIRQNRSTRGGVHRSEASRYSRFVAVAMLLGGIAEDCSPISPYNSL